MGKITVFNHMTVDGYFAGPNGEIDWFAFMPKDEEWYQYTHRESASRNTLVYGHKTYTMMKEFWPTPQAINSDPFMADVVNNSPKIVFSKTLPSVEEGPNWKNIRLFREINPNEISLLKKQENMTILGSGSIVQQFSKFGLIDGYFIVVVPILLGSGKPLFRDVITKDLTLLEARSIRNGLVILNYQVSSS